MAERFWAPVMPEQSPPASMPKAELVVIDEQADGTFLLRYTATGEFGGDTWHRSVDDAKAQAAFEYGPDVSWAPIPDTESDAVAFAIRARRI